MIRQEFNSTLTMIKIQKLATFLDGAKVAVLFGDLCAAPSVDLMILADALDAPLIYTFGAQLMHVHYRDIKRKYKPIEGGWRSVNIAVAEGRFLLVLGVEGAYNRLCPLTDNFALINPAAVSSSETNATIQTDIQEAVTQILRCLRRLSKCEPAVINASLLLPSASDAPIGLAP